MTVLENAIEAITQQQSKLQKNSAPFFVGEQLKDILRGTPSAAGIVLQDLKTAGMGIADCEKKIADFASKHRTGSTGCCPPMEADRIIREFYGIPFVGVDLANGPDWTGSYDLSKGKSAKSINGTAGTSGPLQLFGLRQ